MKTALTHARVVLPHDVVHDAAVLIEDGVIRSVEPYAIGSADLIDLRGHTLLPGLVDLHCDALEKEVEPRPNVFFPLDFAVAQADVRNAQVGITTVFHALSFAHEELGVRNNEVAADVVRAVRKHSPHGLVDNRVHCRYEISDESALAVLIELLQSGSMHLLSFMDHTPGQGQFRNIASYRDYLTATYAKTQHEADAVIQRKFVSVSRACDRMAALASEAARNGVRLASHDDDHVERLDAMELLGVRLSEFPVNMETARAAKRKGFRTIFGGPNVLRGGSQTGSLKAMDAVMEGVADCLCSDYSPASLLAAVFSLAQAADMNLAEVVRLVTANPAQAAGLHDRGEIRPGKRADLVAVQLNNTFPRVSSLWVRGNLVYQTRLGNE